ncbi:MAG: trehalose-phosphatase [Streptosporangiaceae bacterium]
MASAEANGLPVPRTAEGRSALEAILSDPGTALIAMDFDGTLSPIVADPREARAHPGAVAGLRGLAGLVGTLAVITGRPAGEAVELGGFGSIPGLIVLGHYGWERWEDGALAAPPPPPGVATARARLPELLAEAGAPEGTRIEDKGSALAVHTRRTADPAAALAAVTDPLADLAAATGLTLEPGRLVIELRPPGMDKGSALTALAAERKSGAILFAGDDLGDLPAFGAVRALRAAGHPGLTVCSASGEVSELAAEADLVVAGPDEVAALLRALARSLAASSRPAR